jgi:hypothetical protein
MGLPVSAIITRFAAPLGHSLNPSVKLVNGSADAENHHSDAAYDHYYQKDRNQIDRQAHLNQSAYSIRSDRSLGWRPSRLWDYPRVAGG